MQSLLHEGVISASGTRVVHTVEESLVEVEEVFPIAKKSCCWSFLEGVVVVDGRVVDLNTFDVVVLGVVLVKHGIGDIRNILPCVGLASDVDFVSSQTESVHEVLPKGQELVGDVGLVHYFGGGSRRCWRETRADWLVDVHHVGQVCPRVGVANRLSL